jgi:dipeptidyl aminopeptidase/acylaminoacyl peptidase
MAIVLTAVVSALFHAPRLNAQGKHLVTGDDLMSQMKYIDHLQLSPDGRYLAYTIGGEDSLWLMTETKQSRALDNGFIPRWSPDGTRLAFYSIRSGTPELWIFDLKTSQSIQITNFEGGINPDPVARLSGFDEEPLHYSWSPDGSRIAFASRINPKPSGATDSTGNNAGDADNAASRAGRPLVLTDTTPYWWTSSGLFKFDPVRTAVGSRDTGTAVETDENYEPAASAPNQLFIVDVESKKLEQLSNGDSGYFSPQWSPDGKEIVCVSNEGRPMTGYGPDTTNIYAMNLATRQVKALTTGSGQKRLPTLSADGKWIAYLGGKQFEIASLYVLPGAGGSSVNLTEGLDRLIWNFQWDPKSDAVFLSYRDGISVPIARVAVPGGKLSRLTQDDSLHFPFTVSRSNKIVWAESSGSSSGVVRQSDLESDGATELLDLNPRIREWVLGEQGTVRWKNGRGEEIEGILIKPVGYQKGKAYPLIVDPYPGAGVNGFMSYLMTGNQAFASRGYAVFFPNERTAHTWWNPYKGKAFDEATRGPQGPDIMMDDLMSGIDTVVKMGVADPDRICLYGFSNGGGATTMIVTRSTRFKCAVAASGAATDLTSYFFMLGDPETYVKEAGGRTPWGDPEAYIKLSPLYHLDRVTTPMLLAAGDQETVGALISTEMYTGLRYLGRDVTFLRYPNQGHGFTGAALKDYWQRVNAFFDKYLHPEPPAIPAAN